MKRTLVLSAISGVLVAGAGCAANEHGDAPRGQHAPGGTWDNAGNAATSRALGEDVGGEAPVAALERDSPPAAIFDAGAQSLRPLTGREQGEVVGRVTALEDGSMRVQPEQGPSVHLQFEDFSQVMLGGSLVSESSLRPGAEVRASYVLNDGRRTANDVAVLSTPDLGRGMFQPQLQPPGVTPGQPAPDPQRREDAAPLDQAPASPDVAAPPHGPAAGSATPPPSEPDRRNP